ncbi:MAG TPA: tetratricopeptide repeat protein [Candidatus Competibacteraceae bacterium]|nr:tetratricopeptide repeat protein [Candidatus Competibacteraceae bacterium]
MITNLFFRGFIHRFLISIVFWFFILACRFGYATPLCGDLNNSFGPFDYRDPKIRQGASNPLHLVEMAHFTPKVESLIRGNAGTLMQDIDYTLRAFPNHPRALNSVARYERQQIKKAKLEGGIYTPPMMNDRALSAECYFDRAIRWRPDDPNVRLVYGIHLHLSGRLNEALQQYKMSEKIQPNVADLQYNLGLLYFDMKQYALAKQHARKAYQLGYPLPGLRKKLVSVGQWP